MSQPSGARCAQTSSNFSKPGIDLAAIVFSGPAATRLTRTRCGPEVAGQVAGAGLEAGLGHAHPVVARPGDRRVEVEADDRAAVRHQRAAPPSARDLSEKVDTCTALATSSHGVARKLPPSAACGAFADRVHHAVEAVDVLADPVGERLELADVGHVELDHRRLGRAAAWRSAPPAWAGGTRSAPRSPPAPAPPAPRGRRSRRRSAPRSPGSACRRECPSQTSFHGQRAGNRGCAVGAVAHRAHRRVALRPTAPIGLALRADRARVGLALRATAPFSGPCPGRRRPG